MLLSSPDIDAVRSPGPGQSAALCPDIKSPDFPGLKCFAYFECVACQSMKTRCRHATKGVRYRYVLRTPLVAACTLITAFCAVIIGAGPAGLMLSTCLARWGYRIKHIDNRAEPTPTGRADGIQPRSLDLLRNMGLKSSIMAHEPARVYEVAFWDPPEYGKGIVRTGTWASCPGFIDARYPFTTLLHQGLIESAFITDLAKHNVHIQRPWTIKGWSTARDHLEVRLEHVDGTACETVRTQYLFGGDGAKSFVRERLGIGVRHKDPIAHVWGVMDGVVKTNFPDIKVSHPSR